MPVPLVGNLDEKIDPELRALLREFNLANEANKEAKRKARETGAELKELNQQVTKRFLEKDIKCVPLGKSGLLKIVYMVKLETFDDL
jgi:isopentenyl phosphate kinase